jgi:shikimate kinase
MPHLTLIGYRGSGKSSLAARLAERLGCRWVDADDRLEQELGSSIASLIGTRGEPFFRDREADLLARLLAEEPGVLATGGGVVLRAGNRLLLRERGRPVIWLTAPAAVLRGRLAADPATATRRPPLTGGDPLDEVAAALAEREPLYREIADAVIDVSEDSPTTLAERIDVWLAHRPAVPDAKRSSPETIP